VPQQRIKGRFDYLGSALIVGALICPNLGLGGNFEIGATTTLDTLSSAPPFGGTLLIASGVLLALFIVWELRVKFPLIDLRMFKKPAFSAGATANLLVGYALFIGLVSVPILVNVRQTDASTLRQAALQVGILLSALTVPMAIAAIPGGYLAGRIGYRLTTILGLLLAVIGFTLIWQTWSLDMSDTVIALEMALVGVGIGLTFSPISASVINAAGDDQRGVSSALVLVLRLIGMTLSVSSLTTIALQRVNYLAAIELGGVGLDPIGNAYTYAEITVRVLGELGLIGAVICGIAVIPALLLPRRGADALAA
jgi:MFS family permease